jgi:hypothetical protein
MKRTNKCSKTSSMLWILSNFFQLKPRWAVGSDGGLPNLFMTRCSRKVFPEKEIKDHCKADSVFHKKLLIGGVARHLLAMSHGGGPVCRSNPFAQRVYDPDVR